MFYEDHGKNAVPFFFVHEFDNEPAGVIEGVMKAQKEQMFYEDHGKSVVPFFFVHEFDNEPAGEIEGVM